MEFRTSKELFSPSGLDAGTKAMLSCVSLSPADVLNVVDLPAEKSCRVIVPDDQPRLAIGKEGQNARLADKVLDLGCGY